MVTNQAIWHQGLSSAVVNLSQCLASDGICCCKESFLMPESIRVLATGLKSVNGLWQFSNVLATQSHFQMLSLDISEKQLKEAHMEQLGKLKELFGG